MTEKVTKRTKKVKVDPSLPDNTKLRPFVALKSLSAGIVTEFYKNLSISSVKRALGIDPSLTGTVAAFYTISKGDHFIAVHDLSKSVATKGVARVASISNKLIDLLESYPCNVVVLEDYAHGAAHQAHPLGELGFALRYCLAELQQIVWPFGSRVGTVPIGTWKKSLGLAGNAPKIAVQMWLAERYSLYIQNNDIADSVCLAIYAMSLITGEIPPKGAVIDVTYF